MSFDPLSSRGLFNALFTGLAAAESASSAHTLSAGFFSTLLKLESESSIAKAAGSKDEGRIPGGREKSIIAMRLSVENTVKNSYGQIVERTVKN